MIKVIILDFDGVVLESVDVKTQVYHDLFSRYTKNIEPIVEYHLKNNGISRFLKFEYIWKNFIKKEYNEDIKELLAREFSNIALDKVIKSPFVAGSLEFLKEFFQKVPLYIASAVPKDELDKIIKAKAIENYFASVYGFPPTPKSRAIEDIMAKESASSEEILFIGDSRQDLKVALESGVFFIARKNKEDFEDFTIPIFDDMKEIADYITNNLKVKNERIRYSQ